MKILFVLLFFSKLLASELVGSYIYFNDDEIKQYFKNNFGNDYLEPSNENEFIYKELEKYTLELYDRYSELLGPYFDMLPQIPHIALGHFNGVNGIGVSVFEGINYTQNIIRVDKESFETGHSYAILAHEMAHYFLNHPSQIQRSLLIHSIYEFEHSLPIASSHIWENDYTPQNTEEFISINRTIEKIGLFYLFPEFVLPFDFYISSNGLTGVMQTFLEESDPSNQNCKEAIEISDQIGDEILSICSAGLQVCIHDKDTLINITELINNFETPAGECFKNKNQEFLKLVSFYFFDDANLDDLKKKYNQGSIEYKNSFEAQFFAILYAEKNPLEIIKDLFKNAKAELEWKLSKTNLNFANIRTITMEDEADILAQIILENKNPQISAEYFWFYLNDYEKQQCRQIVDDQELEPVPGLIIDPHRSPCYRYWRSLKLSRELKETKDSKKYLIENILKLNKFSIYKSLQA
ncbi:MAG: hypothetical protein H6622_05705 [Halobacteriovoraceae bacterium]|nr:hypothetical protein [Halobacteriovoraceae bacterium]